MKTRGELIEVSARGAWGRRLGETLWDDLPQSTINNYMADAESGLTAIEAAGCVVVPKKLIAKCGNNHMNCPHSPAIKSWLAASPFAPEAKTPPP